MLPSAARRRADRLGQSLTWLCAGALAFNLLLALGLLLLIAVSGLGYFWQQPLVLLTLRDGSQVLGEIQGHEEIPAAQDGSGGGMRTRLKIANRDLYGLDFRWIDDDQIVGRAAPADAVLVERFEWGNFFGTMRALRRGDQELASGPAATWAAFGPLHREKMRQRAAISALEKGAISDVNYQIERGRLAARRVELSSLPEAERAERLAEIHRQQVALQAQYEALAAQLFAAREELDAETVVMVSADGREKAIPVGAIVMALQPNAMSTWQMVRLYGQRLWAFVADDPRESNTEGGIFPAIFGTVMMVFLMSFVVAPFGVVAALYLREYAREGAFVRMVRIAVNNLAGVPSIVFGVFGLGFFVYLIGGSIDRLFYPEALPTPTFGTGGILWASLTLALLTVPVVIVATEEGLAAVPRVVREGSLALGATKFETTWRVVLPAAAPGILTGMILAMARAAGEVAPLMIVGMVKLAPALPIDGHFPFVHLERKFMHLGFHIYDVGFQSPNVEATQPLVFATALLLVLVVVAMNLIAVVARNRLRSRYASSAV
ncbi:phosphate ABC transporter permease PstA [bacterium]|nr:phosphate ABC transporter permease PstA [bacterium]